MPLSEHDVEDLRLKTASNRLQLLGILVELFIGFTTWALAYQWFVKPQVIVRLEWYVSAEDKTVTVDLPARCPGEAHILHQRTGWQLGCKVNRKCELEAYGYHGITGAIPAEEKTYAFVSHARLKDGSVAATCSIPARADN